MKSTFQWASQAMREKKWKAAIDRWMILREVYPDKIQTWEQAVVAHRKREEFNEAEDLLRSAKKRFPETPKILIQEAELNFAKKDYDAALDNLENLHKNFPEEILGWVRMADIYIQRKQYDLAEEFNIKAREKFSDHPLPWTQYSELAMHKEQWGEALRRWDIVRKRFPENTKGYLRAAVAAEKIGDLKLARNLKIAKSYGPDFLNNQESENQNNKLAINPNLQNNWKSFIDLVTTKARLNLKSEANTNYLHFLWWLIEPMLNMAVYYLVFGVLLHRGGPGYLAYLLTGQVAFQWFSKTVSISSNSIISGKGLMFNVRISPLFFPFVSIVQSTLKQLPVFMVLFVFLVFYGMTPTVYWLGFIPIFITEFLLVIVCSCCTAMIVPFFRDLNKLIPVFLHLLMFGSAIFYKVDHLSEELKTIFYLNPMANIILQYRRALTLHQWPNWQMLFMDLQISLVCMVCLWLVYKKTEQIYPRLVLE